MRTTKRNIAVVALLALGAFVVASRNRSGDEEVARQLARQQQRVTAVSPQAPASKQAGSTPDSFQVARGLTARRHASRNTWLVSADRSSSYMTLPFEPPATGSRVDAVGASSAGEFSAGQSANPGFLGADVCAECHREKHGGFVHTAHYQTSGVVGASAMHGHFSGPERVMKTSDPLLSFEMMREGEQYLQRVNFADYTLDVPMDVFTGSAKTGQTFLYWHDDELYQAFVSYLTELDEWIPSPGYTDRTVDYSRAIRTGCLECHVTYIEQKRPPNVYRPETAVWGISCERCHGPGREHVDYHRAHPDDKLARHIVQPADLPRQRQLDICAQCHSGGFTLLGDAFAFRPGDELAKFHQHPDASVEGVGGIHTSNQLTRLSMSKCFAESEMTCTSCHNPHENQRGNRSAFTARCLTCHTSEHCGMFDQLGASVADNCIDCHMPVGDNENMTIRVSGGSFTVQMIDHYIRVDRRATEKYLSK